MGETRRERGGWSGERIRAAILGPEALIEQFIDLDMQIQPNGFDLTLARVGRLVGPGTLPADNAGRQLPAIEDVPLPDDGSVVHLEPGPYQIGFNEVVRMPLGTMALGRARSTLNRSGVTIHTAVWDAGYAGRSTALLSVLNPAGFSLGRDARVLQLIFFDLSADAPAGYSGAYQNENMPARSRRGDAG